MNIKKMGHLSFNCKNLQKSIKFYTEILGFEVKFSLYYSDFLEIVKGSGYNVPKFAIKLIGKKKDSVWLTYLEISDGIFVELFDQVGAFLCHRVLPVHLGYQHFAIVVDDIEKTKEELISKGVKIDIDVAFGPDFTYQMWIHDPDGNKIEIMQYTEKSLQVTGE